MVRDVKAGQVDEIVGPVVIDWQLQHSNARVGAHSEWYRLRMHDGRQVGISRRLFDRLMLLAHPEAPAGRVEQTTRFDLECRISRLIVFRLPELSWIVEIHDAGDRIIYREPKLQFLTFEL